ncbi:MAG TPA: hypothetical protein VK151_13090 [Fluviicola sp.]|nr:hypothetical protein [Fluviicola sp.]
MQFYYIQRFGKWLNKEKTKRYALYLVFFIGLTGQTALSQTENTAAIDQLLAERSSRITQSESTRDLDYRLFELGYRPKAVITTETLENGNLRVVFPTYLSISADKKIRIEERLSQHYSYMSHISVDTELKQVTLILSPNTSTEELDSIFDHFGYAGHE